MSPGEPGGRPSRSGREAVKRLDEDAARAFRTGAEKTADSQPKTNPVPENGFLGEATRVAAVDPPRLVAARGTGGVGIRRRDPQSEGHAIAVGADQATADGNAQKLEQKQEKPPKGWEQ